MKGKCADLMCRLYLVRNHDRSHACAVSRTDAVKRILNGNRLCGVCVKNFAGLQKNIWLLYTFGIYERYVKFYLGLLLLILSLQPVLQIFHLTGQLDSRVVTLSLIHI